MQPFIWKVPTAQWPGVLEHFRADGLTVQPCPGYPRPRFVLWRGKAGQIIEVLDDTGEAVEFTLYYSLTWPWRWSAEARLFAELQDALNRRCHRTL